MEVVKYYTNIKYCDEPAQFRQALQYSWRVVFVGYHVLLYEKIDSHVSIIEGTVHDIVIWGQKLHDLYFGWWFT
jgi:hypothetical protein